MNTESTSSNTTSSNDQSNATYIDLTPTWGEWGNVYRALSERGAPPAALRPLAHDFARAMAACQALKSLMGFDATDHLSLSDQQRNFVNLAIAVELKKQGFPSGRVDEDQAPSTLTEVDALASSDLPSAEPTKPKISPRVQLMRDTLCTCIEGGSTYWLSGKPARKEDPSDEILGWYYAGVTQCRDAEDGATKFDNITLATIETGFRRIIDGTVKVRADLAGFALNAWNDPDNGDIDAEAADCILQAGLFGELVYG